MWQQLRNITRPLLSVPARMAILTLRVIASAQKVDTINSSDGVRKVCLDGYRARAKPLDSGITLAG